MDCTLQVNQHDNADHPVDGGFSGHDGINIASKCSRTVTSDDIAPFFPSGGNNQSYDTLGDLIAAMYQRSLHNYYTLYHVDHSTNHGKNGLVVQMHRMWKLIHQRIIPIIAMMKNNSGHDFNCAELTKNLKNISGI